MKISLSALACFAVAALATDVNAAEWLKIGGGGQSPSTLYMDAQTAQIDLHANIGTVWTSAKYKKPSQYNGYKISEIKSQYEVDCDSRKLAMLRSIAYGSAGTVLFSVDTPSAMEDAVPDTVGDAVVAGVCLFVQAMKKAPQ
jgi:hypothetical protein